MNTSAASLSGALGRRDRRPGEARVRTRGALRRASLAYALLAPAVVLVLGVLAYPLGWEVWISFTDFASRAPGAPAFIGLANYRTMAGDPIFWRAVVTTVTYLVVTTVLKVVLGIAMALPLARPARWRAFVFLAVFLPWAFPGSVTVMAWYWMLNPPLLTSYSAVAGAAKEAVDAALGSGAWAFLSVVLFNVWRGASFTAVFLLAGLNAIPTELFEYAEIETGSAWQRLRHVTLPLLRPFVALAVFLSLTTAFADLANVWMLTGGRIVFPLVGTYAYWLGIHEGRIAEAATWSVSLIPLLAAALVILFQWFDAKEDA